MLVFKNIQSQIADLRNKRGTELLTASATVDSEILNKGSYSAVTYYQCYKMLWLPKSKNLNAYIIKVNN